MKKLVLLFVLGLVTIGLQAQDKKVVPSPPATITQQVGATDITIDYSRPGAKGRAIFGDDGLVPYGKLWRTGANAATEITFSTDVTIEGKAVKAGTYAIVSNPGMSEWTINFYTPRDGYWSVYKDKDPATSVKVMSKTSGEKTETFTISIGDIKDDSATIFMSWENTVVPVKIGV